MNQTAILMFVIVVVVFVADTVAINALTTLGWKIGDSMVRSNVDSVMVCSTKQFVSLQNENPLSKWEYSLKLYSKTHYCVIPSNPSIYILSWILLLSLSGHYSHSLISNILFTAT